MEIRGSLRNISHIALETCSDTVKTAAIYSVIYSIALPILRTISPWPVTAKAGELIKFVAVNTFVDSLFANVEGTYFISKNPIIDKLTGEKVRDWEKEAKETLFFALSFFPKIALFYLITTHLGLGLDQTKYYTAFLLVGFVSSGSV